MELQKLWTDMSGGELQKNIDTLFPNTSFSLETMFGLLFEGRVWDAIKYMFETSFDVFFGQFVSLKSILVFMLTVGLVTALVTLFCEILEEQMCADISFYYSYLLIVTVLIRGFIEMKDTAADVLENIIIFVKMMVPTYFVAVGMSTGSSTLMAAGQLETLLIYGLENILKRILLPLGSTFFILTMVNGVWEEEKLNLLMELFKSRCQYILKGVFLFITGIGVFQSSITPYVDSLKRGGVQKVIAVIPGIGDAADQITDIIIGSATVVKNSMGVVLMLLILLMCAGPLLKIAVYALLFKCAAAFMGIVCDKRIATCTDRVADSGLLLLKISGVAMLLFMVVITILGRGVRGI